ncbi:MAG: DUF3592 domain-containing protein [Lachnospiraceae bacterium]|nr:DUF3592 domain-containing protein [Lachnospiraceae bacterium]
MRFDSLKVIIFLFGLIVLLFSIAYITRKYDYIHNGPRVEAVVTDVNYSSRPSKNIATVFYVHDDKEYSDTIRCPKNTSVGDQIEVVVHPRIPSECFSYIDLSYTGTFIYAGLGIILMVLGITRKSRLDC